MRTLALLLPPLAFSFACAGILGGDTGVDSAAEVEDCKWFRDQDGDGFGDPDKAEKSCEKPSGYVRDGTDCDDDDASVNPEEVEVCDSVDADENCNGVADEEDEGLVLTIWYADTDNDSYGDPEATEAVCDQPDGFVDNADDCDDTDRKINPDGLEVCDGAGGDEDCDGDIDSDDATMAETDLPTWYRDSDSDGYGDPDGITKEQCDEPSGYAITDDDCDDSDRNVNPGESEVCGNGVDDNCNNASGSKTTSSAAATFLGQGTSAYTGQTVDSAGDFNGDGNDDLLIGAYGGSSNKGQVFVMFGGGF